MSPTRKAKKMQNQMGLEIDTETRKVTRLVDVPLQPAELGQLGVEAGKLSGELSTAERVFDGIKKEHTSIIKSLDNQLQSCLDKLQKKNESREVECIEKRCYASNCLQVFYGDEMLEERAMTVEERQMTFGEPKNGVVLDPEEADETVDREQDLKDVMKAERSPNKPSLVDMN